MSTNGRTVTNTRTQVEVEEIQVEETQYLCRNCDQAYDEDRMLTVGVELNEDGEAEEERQLCRACAESVLDYREPETLHEYVNEIRKTYEIEEVAKALFWLSGAGSIAIGLLTFGIGAIWNVSERLAESMIVVQPTTGESAPVAAQVFESVIPLTFMMMFIFAIVHMKRLHGGGGMLR